MLKKILIVALLSFPSIVFAQQVDPEFLQKAISSLQIQRNNALDAQVVSESKLATANEQLAKANQKIKELEDKTTEKPKKDNPK
jgi:uncharacterized membrane protein